MSNLHLVTGYHGTDHVTAADQGSLYAGIFGTGNYVLNRGSKLAATVVTSNHVRIADGDIILQGRHIRLSDGMTVDLTIENGAQGLLRNDLIVARYSRNASSGIEEAKLVVIKGVAVSADPVDPEYNTGDLLTDNAEIADFPLYRIPLDGITVGTPVQLFEVVEATLGGLDTKSIRTKATIGTTWNGSATPYTQTISIAGVKADSIVEISLSANATADQAKAFQNLCLQDGGQADGSITLRCFGTKNTISIPVNVVIRRD